MMRSWCSLGTALLVLTFSSTAALAQRATRPLAGEPPTAGIHLSTPSLIGEDASTVEVSPAGSGLLDGWSALYHHSELKSDGRIDGAGDALFFTTPLPLLRALTVGLGLQWLRPADAIGYRDYFKLDLNLSWRIGRAFSLGATYHTFFADNDAALDGLDTVDLGAVLLIREWLAAGLVVRDLTTPLYAGLPLQRVYDLEIALRPFSSRRAELGLGLAIGERRGEFDPHFRLELEPVSGLRLFGYLQLLTRDFYRDGGSTTDVRGTVGFGFDLERVGLSLAAVAARQMPAGPGELAASPTRDSFQGLEVTLRVQQRRQAPMVHIDRRLLHLELSGELRQRELVRLQETLRAVEQRADVPGVLLEINGLQGGWAQMQELRGWVQRLRRGGKKVYAHLRAASQREYYLAAAADRVLLDPAGAVDLRGFAARSLYFRGTFDLLGISPQFVKIAEFKSAPEAYTRRNASPAAEEVARSGFNDLLGQISRDVAADRRKTVDQLLRDVNQGPYIPPRALAAGLVDELVESGDLKSTVEKALNGSLVGESAIRLPVDRWPVGPRIAVVVVDGDIVSGKSVTIPLLDRRLVGHETINKALARARSDRSVKAVVLRVNSPGGSAWASDKMWRELMRTREVKPVVVSMGDVAASGGYYLASAGDWVLAERATVTGSIGIFTGKFDVSGLMKRLGLNLQTLASFGQRALIDSFDRPYTEEERAFVLSQLQYFYRKFLEAVAKGRHMTQDQVHTMAKGRVWTGQQARARGLVDAQGGLIDALEEARRRAGLPQDRPVSLVVLPEQEEGLLQKVLRLGGIGGQRSGLQGVALPPAVIESLRGLPTVLLRARSGEPLARMPFHLEF